MQKLIADPINEAQEVFNSLCILGGGPEDGPKRRDVQGMLRHYGQRLNSDGYAQVADALAWAPEADPWKVAFAVGLCWGTIAKFEKAFIEAAVRALTHWDDAGRNDASKFHLEKGWELLEGSLRGGYVLFADDRLPSDIPHSLDAMDRAQNRWFGSLQKLQPSYVGPWNALALFMTALFARPDVARGMRIARPLLPTGGPITAGLRLLNRAHLVAEPANTTDDQDTMTMLGGASVDNGVMASLLEDLPDCSMVDIHSGIYLLGTRDRRSRGWLQ